MRRILITILVVLPGTVTGVCHAAEQVKEMNPVIERLRSEGIRAKSRGDLEKMEAAGFNLVLPWEQVIDEATKSSPPDSDIMLNPGDFSEEALRELRNWAVQSRKHHQIMLYMMYVGAEHTVRFISGLEGDLQEYARTGKGVERLWPAHEYRHMVDWNGDAARWAPCPLERRYWLGFIRPQLERVARTLRETGTEGGGALELETYCFYSIYPGMASQKKSFCYCEDCFGRFVKTLAGAPPSPDLPAGKRFDWLTQRGLLPRYERFLEDQLTGIIHEVLLEVRKIKPDFIFGFYPYAPFWYYDALIRGGGTPELPCLVFPSAEYDGGFTKTVSSAFFGDAPTAAGISHIKRRGLPALYAGGIWAKSMHSADAIAMAMDRLLRGADGYWVYDKSPEPFYEQGGVMNRWTTAHPGPLPTGDTVVNAMDGALARLAGKAQAGLVAEGGRIVARFEGDGECMTLFGSENESEDTYRVNWEGRGVLPALDNAVFHTGASSIRFQPSASGEAPISPYIDRKISENRAVKGRKYELSFWVKARGTAPLRFWVGQAGSNQYPAYMYYNNFMVEPGTAWKRLRMEVRYKAEPPLVLRFWTPPSDGTLWLDNVTLRPIRERTIEIPLTPPTNAKGWGVVEWTLSPADARCEADLVDPEDGHTLRMRLYSGDSLAPLEALVGLRPVLLRLQISPSAEEPVVLKEVQIGFKTLAS